MASSSKTVLADEISTSCKNNSTLKKECHDIASEIQLRNRKLCSFVEELGPLLTSKDVALREKGVTMLSLVLSEIPKDFFTEPELYFITAFYCDRMQDHHSIIPVVLQGILSLVQMKHLPQVAPARLFRIMFDHIRCQSQLMPDRRNIYLIFKTLLENRADDLKEMGADFIYGVISAIDGERDPTNLMLLFDILPKFMKEFKLGHLTEEMFEVIACYFPVDFNPAGSDKLKITRDDLADALAPCLCAIPEFAEFCIPLICDKLSSALKIAKMDSLNLLCRGAATFGAKALQDHLSELWPVLRTEIIPGGDPDIKALALKALTAIIAVISEDETVQESFVDKIIVDAKSSLCDVRLSLFEPVVKLLESVAMVNKKCCVQILRVVVPLCLGQYSTKTTLEDKVILMETLNKFIQASCELGFCIKDVPELAWADIPRIYLDELTVQDTQLKIKAITGLVIQRVYLYDSHRTILYEHVCKEIDAGCDKMKNVCHSCIASFATLYPEEILTLAREKLQLRVDGTDVQAQIHRLEALSAIAKIPRLGVEIVPKIIEMCTIEQVEISSAALTCIQRLLYTKNVDFDLHHYMYRECNIIDKLIAFQIDSYDNRLLQISGICQSVVRNLIVEEQQVIVNKYAKQLLLENITTTESALITSLLIPLRQNVVLSITDNLLQNLYGLAINSVNICIREISCKLLAVLLNKMADDNQCESTVNYLQNRINDTLGSGVGEEIKHAAVFLQVWLTKAMVTKGTSNSQELLNVLVNMLRNSNTRQYLAEEYSTLISKKENTLTEENYCNVKIFYKQRIFQHLIQQNSSFQDSSRHEYLRALTYLLEEVPVELLFMHLSELVPLLTESLSLDTGQLVLSALATLKLLLHTKNNIFSEEAQSFIPRLLNLLTHNAMRVRITALECLASYCNYSTVVILPYKEDVLQKLGMVLDDRKRLVRKAAVKARTRWFLAGAPGGTNQ